ncbi:MAG: integrase arm-type DNA-binding domain-containing protein [Desulfuromonadales bacterium]|nr:integrase arm-type DNA-binding domain-containing protein [Desulfuromonadales bacterium]
MPKVVRRLTDARISTAKKKDKPYRLSHGEGLYLIVKTDGAKLWRFDYTRPFGKRNTLSFGKYPEVSLMMAQEKLRGARRQLVKKLDPAELRKPDGFEPVAMEWLKRKEKGWSVSHTATTLARMKNNLFPWIGKRPIREITAIELLVVLQRIEARGAIETAHRCKSIAGQVFRYAVLIGKADRDVSSDLKGALQEVVSVRHPAILDPVAIGQLLRDIDNYRGHFITCSALRLAPLVFQRPGELRFAEWSEFNLDGSVWEIPIARMKLDRKMKVARAGEKHLVPLSRQAVAILKELYPLTGQGRLVFPSVRTAPDSNSKHAKPISENTLNSALRGLGYSKDMMTTYGWRAVARSLLDEVLGHTPTAIEEQLFRVVADPLGESFNWENNIEERHRLMQVWSDYLDGLKVLAEGDVA